MAKDIEETTEETVEEHLTGVEKAAILMISIGADASAYIYQNLGDEEIEKITSAIVTLHNVDSATIERVITEFHQMILTQHYIQSGGITYAHEVLEKAIGTDRALEMIRKVQRMMRVKGFNILKDVDPDQLLTFIQKEHPQTISFVLSQLNQAQASSILSELDSDLQVDVVRRFASMDRVTPETISAVEKVLENRIDMISGTSPVLGGLKSIADILNQMGVAVTQKILGDITELDYELATDIKNLMFTFEDIVRLDDTSIQKVLKEVENKELTYALKGVGDEVKDKVLKNMSERARNLVIEEMEFLGAIRLSEVEEAQQRIVDIINKLKEDGQVVILGGSNSEQLVE
ncbi:MAG: flagellar motor switch protein FliG [Candidatus Cloacimonadota bacterium]|nr:MAG: flagellar motor switch protein FliG [Candidatus Cloacimonadota bacterium]PIE77979.1 MAG: flagellar motor switch protein FliG [Candidatus Delongbacteria bacterium]